MTDPPAIVVGTTSPMVGDLPLLHGLELRPGTTLAALRYLGAPTDDRRFTFLILTGEPVKVGQTYEVAEEPPGRTYLIRDGQRLAADVGIAPAMIPEALLADLLGEAS